MTDEPRSVLIIGAGVIGRCLAGFLEGAEHTVTILARDSQVAELSTGFELDSGAASGRVRPTVISAADADEEHYDVAFVCVRQDQVGEVIDLVRSVRSGRVVLMSNWVGNLESVLIEFGDQRSLAAFPGFGGYIEESGVTRYTMISGQRTTIGARLGLEGPVAALLGSTELACVVEEDMEGWLLTHAVFISSVAAATAHHGGEVARLGASRSGVRSMIAAIREGFAALESAGGTVSPPALKTIFTKVPLFFSTWFWQRQLQSDTGRVSLGPHFAATANTETPALLRQVLGLLANDHTPTLDRILGEALEHATVAGEGVWRQ